MHLTYLNSVVIYCLVIVTNHPYVHYKHTTRFVPWTANIVNAWLGR